MKVEIYGTQGCNFCTLAVELAERNRLDYTYIDASEDMMKFGQLFPSARTVPQIIVDGKWVGGYSDFKEVFESV